MRTLSVAKRVCQNETVMRYLQRSNMPEQCDIPAAIRQSALFGHPIVTKREIIGELVTQVASFVGIGPFVRARPSMSQVANIPESSSSSIHAEKPYFGSC